MLAYTALLETSQEKTKFEKLYLAHRQGMYYTAYAVPHDCQLAEDAVHQSFLKLVHHLRQADETDAGGARAYLITIARNCAIDLYHKQRDHACVPLDSLVLEAEEPDMTGGAENLVAAAVLHSADM